MNFKFRIYYANI